MENPVVDAGARRRNKILLGVALVPAAIGILIAVAQTSAAVSTMQTAFGNAQWFSNVKVSFSGDSMTIASDGIPNWSSEKYSKPNQGIIVPTGASDVTLDAGASLIYAQKLSYAISLNPIKAAEPTTTSLGAIGILVNGAVLFNPFEGDGKTPAMASTVGLTDSSGTFWGFIDTCNGHPGMGGMYHYHAMPPCVTKVIDKVGQPSHILGVLFDGFPIYGNIGMDGKVISSSQLDACNGITSPTPEFPNGIYHYVLTVEKSVRSTINCYGGTPNPALINAGGGMPGMGGPPAGGPPAGGPPAGGGAPPAGPTPPTPPTPTPAALSPASPTPTPAASSQQNVSVPTPSPTYTTLYKAVKSVQTFCSKGKTIKTVATKTCPKGYKLVSSKTVTTFVEQKVLVAATAKP